MTAGMMAVWRATFAAAYVAESRFRQCGHVARDPDATALAAQAADTAVRDLEHLLRSESVSAVTLTALGEPN